MNTFSTLAAEQVAEARQRLANADGDRRAKYEAWLAAAEQVEADWLTRDAAWHRDLALYIDARGGGPGLFDNYRRWAQGLAEPPFDPRPEEWREGMYDGETLKRYWQYKLDVRAHNARVNAEREEAL